jgi:hypothetical protein
MVDSPPSCRFQFRLRTLMIGTTLFCLMFGGCLSLVEWLDRPNIFRAIYERIQPGMTISEVRTLLGRPGNEQVQSQLPQIVDWTVPFGSPNRLKTVVTGEQYFRWDNDDGEKIIVSLRRGVVSEKWYWYPAL